MAEKLKVSLVTPEATVAQGQFDMVVAPSVQGQVGILPQHRELLANLELGVVELRVDGTTERFAVSGGFVEVRGDAVVLLVDAAERRDNIDVVRCKAALAAAEEQLAALDPLSEAYAQQLARARRARNRLDVVNL